MIRSLGEVEAQARKAARGAGLPWGLAEEAGKAARWLDARGLGGLALLARALERREGAGARACRPRRHGGEWRAGRGHLCPIAAGALLSDRIGSVAAGQVFRTGPVAAPLLLAPFLAAAAGRVGAAFELEWTGAWLAFDRTCARVAASPGSLAVAVAAWSACRPGGARRDGVALAAPAGPVEVDDQVWRCLDRFVEFTYVPASPASRLRGAGAGDIDNE